MENLREPMDFGSTDPITIPVTINGEKYELREASGAAATEYTNGVVACTTLGSDGKPISVRGIASLQPVLVSRCLFKIGQDGSRTPVPPNVIEAWPQRVRKGLFERLEKISDLETPEVGEQAKNDSSGTTDGSS